MKSAFSNVVFKRRSLGIATALIGYVFFCLSGAVAQTGPNAVYNSSGSCCTASPAFIDASAFHSGATNFCGVVKLALLSSNFIAGGVIDARGLNPNNTSMTCPSTQPSPWYGISSPPASTILLPATGGGTTPTPIVIPSGWVLPAGTHLIGVADGDVAVSGSASYSGTTIQAGSGFSGTMISFCPSACSGVSVENLSLDGQGLTTGVIGIANAYATPGYVKNVTLFQIVGLGLSVAAPGSGPYSNITFDTNDKVGPSTTCLSVGASGTQGFHKITCTSLNQAPNAVLLNASSTSLTDVRITGFTDGIVVGSVSSDVLRNVWGDTTGTITTPTDAVILIGSNAQDIAIVGAGNAGAFPTIRDEATATVLYDRFVSLYALGEQGTNPGYSRFTTSPNATSGDANAVTWGTGASAPTGSCAEGSLYSCTGASCNGTSACGTGTTAALWVCGNKSGTPGWCVIK